MKNFPGRGLCPLDASSSGEGDTRPSPRSISLGACGTSTPPIVKFLVRHCVRSWRSLWFLEKYTSLFSYEMFRICVKCHYY